MSPNDYGGDMKTWEMDMNITERHYALMLAATISTDSLIEGLRDWSPFTTDALLIVRGQGFDFDVFKEGLVKEQLGEFAGKEWAEIYGAIMLPSRLMRASLVAVEFHVPLSMAMQRLVDLKQLDGVPDNG
jgi:hypothetical protein